jgi:hypothetical protein
MDTGREYVRDWIGYWGYLSEQVMERCTRASERVRKEKYDLGGLYADVVGFWTDAALATLHVWRGPVRTPQPVIFLLGREDTYVEPKCVWSFLPAMPHEKPSFVWVGCVDPIKGATGNELTWENVDVGIAKDRSGIEVTLQDLDLLTPLKAGTYRAVARLGEVPVAEILIVVQQEKHFSGESTRVSAKKPTAKAGSKTHPRSRRAAGEPSAG